MTTYLLTQRACDHDLPPKRTVTAECIHTDDDFVRFHDANHQLVYAVQRGLLLAIETLPDPTLPDESDPDQDACTVAEPEPDEPGPTTVGIKLDGRNIFEVAQSMAALRDDCMRSVGEHMGKLRTAINQQAAAVTRARCADQYGWTDEQAAEVPDWLVEQLVDHLC